VATLPLQPHRSLTVGCRMIYIRYPVSKVQMDRKSVREPTSTKESWWA